VKYEVEIYEDQQGSLLIDVPDEIFLVADLILSDIQEVKSGRRLKLINNVLSNQSSYEEISGNACVMEVKKDATKIVFKFAEEGEEDHCFIETEELRNIFLLWDKAIEKMYRKVTNRDEKCI